jgi:hypothetical protein
MTDQKVVLITGASSGIGRATAAEVLRAIERPHRMRRPVGFEGRLLSRLRRFKPAGPVDRSVRKAFALI